MAELVQHAAASASRDEAVIDEFGTTTWAELDDRVNRAVAMLAGAGLHPGDTVALMVGNRREFFEMFLAAAHGGWIVVPVNWHWVADELAYVIQNSGARLTVFDDAYLDVVTHAHDDERSSGCTTWIMTGTTDPPEGVESYEELLSVASADPPSESIAGGPMFYTSGTTGFPKGVRSTLSTVGSPSSVLQLVSGAFTDLMGIPKGGTSLLIGPAYHSAQWVFSVLPLLEGSTLVCRQHFDAAETLELIDRYAVTNIHLVPTQFIRFLRLDESKRSAFDGSSLEVVYHGAAPCSLQVKQAMLDWWGPVISEYYGGTEGGFLSLISGTEWLKRPGSLGRALSTVDLMILDDESECAPGRSGQIWFRSKLGNDFEYHDDPDKTTAAHRGDGWGTLGDVGYIDDDGYLYMSDRKIDMIISGGVNIYPAEIEGVLVSHPAVVDAAVFGVPDDEMGESVKAVVQLDDGLHEGRAGDEALAAELIAHVRDHLAGYKAPRTVDFVDRLPRTPTGKLLKRTLRDPYWVGTGRSI